MRNLMLNARFLMRPPTGVDRVAVELVSALLARALPGGAQLRAVHPQGHVADHAARPFALLSRAQALAPLPGHLWEQMTLAAARPDDVLLSLCNLGPVTRRRQVVMIHDAQVHDAPDSYAPAFRHWYHLIQPRLARRAALVLTPSAHTRTALERLQIVPPGKAQIVPNGCDHILRVAPDARVLARNGLEPGRFLLAIGALAPHKNLALLARAAAQRRTRLPLVIAGGGAPGVFRRIGVENGGGIQLIGRVTDAELRALYDAATALVFPSHTEGFGLPPVEAMACGCPVIASTGGALPEVCGDAALLIDAGDVTGWADAMDRIAEDETLRRDLRHRGHARAALFTWDKAAQTLLHHLETTFD